MNQKDTIALVKAQLRNCAGWESDAISQDRVSALNYYLQRERGDEVNGRSGVVAGDVSASVEANLAQMLAAYRSKNIIEFTPLGPEDEDQAQLESDTVVYFMMGQRNGFLQLAMAIKDALLMRNGVMKAWVDEYTETRRRTFNKVAPEVKNQLAAKYGAEIVSYRNRRLQLRTRKEHKRFRCEAVAIENFLYPRDWDSFDLQSVPFCAERHVDTRSDLIRMGFPERKVARIKAYAVDAKNAAGQARQVRSQLPVVTNTPDPSQDRVEWFEIYALIDVDGDGVSERRRICYAWDGDVLLSNEPGSLVPYAIGATMLMPHRVTGISQYDKLRQTQDEHTGLKRALYDNVNAVTKSRLAYLDGKVSPDDIGDGRPNGGIRVKSKGVTDIRQAIMALSVPDNSANVLRNIEALKRERTELGGAALELASGNLQIGGERMGSQGLDRAYSVMEELAGMMTQFIGATLVRHTALLVHAVLRENYREPVPIKRNGKWQSPIPAEWQPRECVEVKPGMSPGERSRRAAALRQILDDQTRLAAGGMEGELVDLSGFYRAYMDWARMVEIPNPEQYYVDPASDAAIKAREDKDKARQLETLARRALMQQAIGNDQTRIALDKYQGDQKTQFDYWAKVLESEIAEAKIVGDATVRLIEARELPTDAPGNGDEAAEAA